MAAREEHIKTIAPKKIFLENPFLEEEYKVAIKAGQAISMLVNGVVVAIIGVVIVNKATAEVWSITSEEVKKHPIEFQRNVTALLEAYKNVAKIKRLQITVRSDFNEGTRWAESLGFVKEGLMKKYGSDGHDHYLYGRVL